METVDDASKTPIATGKITAPVPVLEGDAAYQKAVPFPVFGGRELAEEKPDARVGRIEADLFCEGCGYNLHSQVVTRDERLDFVVVRCPECGKFHPAAMASSVGRVWLNRFGILLLAVWILLCVTVILSLGFVMGCFDVAVVESITRYAQFLPDGQKVEYTYVNGTGGQYVIAGTNESIVTDTSKLVSREVISPWAELTRQWFPYTIMLLIDALAAFCLGVFLATVLWHTRRFVQIIFLILPFVALFFVAMGYVSEDSKYLLWWTLGMILILHTAFQALVMLLGIFTGRKIARLLTSILIPPKPRQFLSFLWTADGLILPVVRR